MGLSNSGNYTYNNSIQKLASLLNTSHDPASIDSSISRTYDQRASYAAVCAFGLGFDIGLRVCVSQVENSCIPRPIFRTSPECGSLLHTPCVVKSKPLILNPKQLNSQPGTKRLQYPLIREYTLNHIRGPTII